MKRRWIIALLFVVAVLPLPGLAAAHPPVAAPGDAARGSEVRLLADLLRSDGTLDLSTGFRGSLDVSGYRLASAPGAAPRFAPDAPGDENWADTFGPQGTGGDVDALALDGSGNLYAGGWFPTAGGVPANYIARWDGSAWSALGSGMNTFLDAVAVDGPGNL